MAPSGTPRHEAYGNPDVIRFKGCVMKARSGKSTSGWIETNGGVAPRVLFWEVDICPTKAATSSLEEIARGSFVGHAHDIHVSGWLL